ncbi:MAG: hypothetical protein KF718_28520 [Polyangiaceae bacterium]|nr:hypothetical protein [Polyangiaceae bacterium]
MLLATGDVRLEGGATLVTGAAIDGTTFVALGADSEIALKDTTSGRELSLHGPALGLPCVAGEEHALLSFGRVRTTASAGSRPGSEVLIATPHGAVRFASGQIVVEVTERSTRVTVEAGEAWADPAEGAKRTGPERLTDPKKPGTLTGPGAAEPLAEACRARAEAANVQARAVLAPEKSSVSLGERARAHVEGRRAARSACFSARAAAAKVADVALRASLETRVRRADSLWKGLPATKR